MEPDSFEALPLHDAVLRLVEINWEKKRCVLHVSTLNPTSGTAAPYTLVFEGVTLLSIPHNEPWGPSSCINSASSVVDGFKIEMQSGDIIEVKATRFSALLSNNSLEGDALKTTRASS
jgi:hypothetical protein